MNSVSLNLVADFTIPVVLDALNAQDYSLPYIYFIILLPAKPISKPRK